MIKEGFVYIWYDKKRKMYYIGCHWGTIDDGYICSSNRMRNAFYRRPGDFRRRILSRNISRNILQEVEHKWLSMIKKEELGKRYYNLRKHKWGHWSSDTNSSLTIKEKISIKTKEAMNSAEIKRKMESVYQSRRGQKQSQEHISKRAKSNTGKKRSQETKQKMSDSKRGEKHHFYGKTLTDSHKQKLSESLLGEKNHFYGKYHTPETKKDLSEKLKVVMKGKKPKNIDQMKFMLWWNNGNVNKRSFSSPGSEWTRGRIQRKKI